MHAPRDRRIIGEPSRPACGAWVIASREDAGKALRDAFLANADRGDNAANDQLVDVLMHRIRALRGEAADADGGTWRHLWRRKPVPCMRG